MANLHEMDNDYRWLASMPHRLVRGYFANSV